MAVVQSLLIRNNLYNGVRLTIVGSQSGDEYFYYSEANGNRYFINEIGGTVSNVMESADFNSFLSFTQSGTVSTTFELIPMDTGDSCMIETKVFGVNSSGTKSYMMKSFGGYVHNGSSLSLVGSGIQYDTIGNFTTGSASFTQSGTQSICLCVSGETGELVDWDVYIKYSKGFHTLVYSPDRSKVIYPPAPSK